MEFAYLYQNNFRSVSAPSTYLNAFGDEVGEDIERGLRWRSGAYENHNSANKIFCEQKQLNKKKIF